MYPCIDRILFRMHRYRYQSKVDFNNVQNSDHADRKGACHSSSATSAATSKNSEISIDDIAILSDSDMLHEMGDDIRTSFYFEGSFLSILNDIRFSISNIASPHQEEERRNMSGSGTEYDDMRCHDIVLSIDVGCTRSLRKKEIRKLGLIVREFLEDTDDTYYVHDDMTGTSLFMSFRGLSKVKGRSSS